MPNNPLNLKLSKNWLFLIVSIFYVTLILTVTNFSSPVRPSHITVKNIEHLKDSKEQYSISNIQNVSDKHWQQNNQDLSSLGIGHQLHWFRFLLQKNDGLNIELLELDYALLDKVNLWFVQDNKVLAEYHTGDTLSFSERPIEHENFVFQIPTHVRPIQVYVSTYSKGVMRLPFNIWQQKDFLAFTGKSSLIMGGFFGLMLAMGLTNLFLFITTRSPTFLLHAGFAILFTLSISAFLGLGYRYIWPNSPWLQQHALIIFANLTACLSIIFCNLLLDVRAHSATVSRLLNITALTFLLAFAVSLFVSLDVFIRLFLWMLGVSSALILITSIWLWTKGIALARYYTLARAILIVCGFVVSLDSLNIIDFSLPSYYLLMLGVGFETVLLTVILAISLNQQQQALLATQTELLNKERHAQHAQKDILAQHEDATEELEYKVQERTLELEIALRELSETNRELQEKNTLDALTGIRNRSYFDKKYQAEVRRSRREHTQLSVVMIDIDHFKKVNDQHGHLVGDECIKAVANTLQAALKRPSDDVCRYGGEEFALILPSTDLEGALVLVEQLRAQIETTTIQADGVSINITISAGIGTAIAELNQAEDVILALADKQLYAAKNAGRNNVQGSHLDLIQHQDQT